MKRLIAFLCSLFLCFLFMIGIKEYYAYKISDKYNYKAAEILSDDKFKSITLQKESIKNGDNLLMFGSSEFESSKKYSTHPFNFFNNKNNGYQVNLIGRAGYKSLIHAIDIASLGSDMKNQKIVFVLSPQWFIKGGIDENTFEACSSELQVYEFLSNPNINQKEKDFLTKRILEISKKKPNKEFQIMRTYCELYSKKDTSSKFLKFIMAPYYRCRHELLSIREKIISYDVLKHNNMLSKYKLPRKTSFDWEKELNKAVFNAQKNSDNEFGMDNNSYKYITKGKLEKLRNSMKKISYDSSPEYDDFRLFLDICKAEKIKPLIINIPVNGRWYDYCGFNKEDRLIYYNKVNSIIKEYGFDVADFSDHEYDNYFLKDGTHLGWKGWIYVDKAIDQFYHQN